VSEIVTERDRRRRPIERLGGADHTGADQAVVLWRGHGERLAGSPIVSRTGWQGKPRVDKGVIVRIDPPRLVMHAHWSDQSGIPDRPENYQGGHLAPRAERCNGVTVSERNLPSEEAKAMSDQVASWAA
jgi:hypothetical protein